MPDNTFDIVSKIEIPEVLNAIQQALKEIHQRYDLKDSKSNIELDGKDAIVLHSIDEFLFTNAFRSRIRPSKWG